MKKIALALIISFSATFSAQEMTIQNTGVALIVNDSLSIKKGDELHILLPAQKDFVFIRPQKKQINTKLLGKLAGAVGTGAAVVGVSSNNIKVLQGTTKVMRGASAVQYGSDAVQRVQDLPLSKDAKIIAGKTFLVNEWNFDEGGWVLTGTINNKRYEVFLANAIYAGELKL